MASGRPTGAARLDLLDAESADWLRELSDTGSARIRAEHRLHAFLVRLARSELRRRVASGTVRIDGPELDDLAHQAAADALLSVMRRLPDFRGESRFSTWAAAFVMVEVSAKLGRHHWQQPTATTLHEQDWDRLPERFGLEPDRAAEWRDLAAALRRGVERELTDHQRTVFVALVLDGVPLDALAVRLGTTRGALYKTVFDARRQLRTALESQGFLERETQR